MSFHVAGNREVRLVTQQILARVARILLTSQALQNRGPDPQCRRVPVVLKVRGFRKLQGLIIIPIGKMSRRAERVEIVFEGV